jgi:hypothetical protein
VASSPSELRDTMRADSQKWADVIKRAGITIN